MMGVLKMRKLYIVVMVVLCMLTACRAPLSDSKIEEDYTYSGETTVEIEGRSFELEEIPESSAEEVVVLDFYYSITGEFDKMKEIISDNEAHLISMENEQLDFEQGRYMQSYTIHQIETLPKDDKVKSIAEQYSLVEYEMINVSFTQIWSEAKLNAWPQYGNGMHSREFLVGKTKDDTVYKIYEYGMM